MAFLDTLNTCCAEYTGGYVHNGTTIPFPYRLGAKNLPSNIRNTIKNWIGTSSKTVAEVQNFMIANSDKTGVDCSGLVYYALNEATSGNVRSYFEGIKSASLPYSNGIPAAELAYDGYGTKITAAKDIKPGCTIRSDNGSHVLVIHSVNKNSAGVVTSIVYAHSNSSKGPHHGSITIGDQTKDLNHSSQTWNDIAYSDAQAKSYYNYTVLLTPVAKYV